MICGFSIAAAPICSFYHYLGVSAAEYANAQTVTTKQNVYGVRSYENGLVSLTPELPRALSLTTKQQVID